ncbi:MAG TPA: metalloregulator ArsR/SmtB family transcription factor [Candidatus Saccharimonadales bacterium]
MDKFYALSAPIRREIIALLADSGELPASSIADNFKVSPPAISQHLKVLLNTNLVRMHKKAQQHIYEINPAAMLELEAWAKQIVTSLDAVSGIVSKPNAEAPLKEAS